MNRFLIMRKYGNGDLYALRSIHAATADDALATYLRGAPNTNALYAQLAPVDRVPIKLDIMADKLSARDLGT